MKISEDFGSGAEAAESRQQRLARRVAEAARVMCEQGVQPSARRVRAAIHGGSPNEVVPALKSWRESSEGVALLRKPEVHTPTLPTEIADLCVELWQRASTAAHIDAGMNMTVRSAIAQETETGSLNRQVKMLREQLQRELGRSGELRAQSARHEAAHRDTAAQLELSERRERQHLRELGEARGRITELEATVEQHKAAKAGMADRKIRRVKLRQKAASPPAQSKGKAAAKHLAIVLRQKAKTRTTTTRQRRKSESTPPRRLSKSRRPR